MTTTQLWVCLSKILSIILINIKNDKIRDNWKPNKHSLSPILHNYWFEKYKIDANYSIIEIENSEIQNLINRIKNKDLIGINITLPYKQKIVPHIDVLINDAEITSSVNTVLDDKGTIVGENTDVFGLQAAYLKR